MNLFDFRRLSSCALAAPVLPPSWPSRMGKQAKWQVSSWYDIRSKPLDPDVIKMAYEAGRLIEYFVPTDFLGVDQGTALLVPGDAGVKTHKGI